MSDADIEDSAMDLYILARRYQRTHAIEDARALVVHIGKTAATDDDAREWAETIWRAYVERGIAAEVEALVSPERRGAIH